ncbi:MAG: RDD family protein [Candidatus Omnitrophica bacterium]|nr:RDD family protein [Candidatus Omnitrophota bacterium]
MENKEILQNNLITKEIKYANLLLRLVALIIDGIVLWCIYLIVFRIFFFNSFPSLENLVEEIYSGKFKPLEYIFILSRTFASLAVFFFISIFYETFLVGKFGATLGKMIVGIKIADENGNKISYGTAFVREVVVKNVIYCIIFFIAWLGYLWAIWDKRKQTWHDKIARTIVIKE